MNRETEMRAMLRKLISLLLVPLLFLCGLPVEACAARASTPSSLTASQPASDDTLLSSLDANKRRAGTLGLYYLRARYLNAASGRFWTEDSYQGTAADPQSLHKYLYCSSDPANHLDPSGHMSIADVQFSASEIALFAAVATVSYIYSRDSALRQATSALASAAIGAVLEGINDSFDAIERSVDKVIARTKELARRRHPDSGYIFLHATSTAAFPGIGTFDNSPDPERGGGDFGVGFYTYRMDGDPRTIPAAMDWATRVQEEYGGTAVIGVFSASASAYGAMSKEDFGAMSPSTYSSRVSAFRKRELLYTGKDVAVGPIAMRPGGRGQPVPNPGLPLQYKFEGGGIRALRPVGGIPLK